MENLVDRILSKCKRQPSGCLDWTGATGYGYGRIKVNGKLHLPHRLIFQLHNPGLNTDGLDVCHSCDNRKCCNVDHLFLGTRRDNMQDCKNKNRLHIRPFKLDHSLVPVVKNLILNGLTYSQIQVELGVGKHALQKFLARHLIKARELRRLVG